MLYKNQLLEHPESGRRIRVLGEVADTRSVWVINMDGPKALPYAEDRDVLDAALDAGEIVEIEGEPGKAVIRPSEKATARRDEAYQCIQPLLGTSDIFDPSKRSALVLARAKELGCSPQTIYKRLRAWWKNGQTRNALIPGFHRIGSEPGLTRNRGRRPKNENQAIYQITEVDREHMKAIAKGYLVDSSVSMAQTHQRLLEEHYSYVDNEGRRIINADGDCPSLNQFRRFIRKNFPRERTVRERHGDAHFELTERPKLGSLRHETYTVADAYEIDATVVDVLVVHPEDRSKIIQKPTAYLIRDRKSGLIVGFDVSLEHPSWIAAQHAIKSISEDKALLCERYGAHFDPNDWPAHRVFPKTFIADRGPEMIGRHSTQLADGLEVTVQNVPARRGDWKPMVECGFKQIQRPMSDCVPGYTPPEEFGERQTRDRTVGAALTLHELKGIFLNAIIRLNRSPMDGYNLRPADILSNMQPTPINIWNTEIRVRAGLPTRYSEEQVRFALLPQTQATVCREGIQLGDCFYSAQEALDRGWFVKAGQGRFKVTVSYDRRLVDQIFIHDDTDSTRTFVAHLLDKCSYFRGKSFAEVEALAYVTKALRRDSAHLKRQLHSDFHAQVDPVVAEATRQAKAATEGKSRSARKKDTVVATEDARRKERQADARLTAAPPPDAPAAAVIPLSRPAIQGSAPSGSRQQLYEDLLNGR